MKFCGCFIGILVLHVVTSVPVPDPDSLVRDKRKVENGTEQPKIASPPKIDSPPNGVIPKDMVLEDGGIPVEAGEKQERVKKQAYMKVPCGKSCNPEQGGPEIVFLKPDDPVPAGAVELKPVPPKGARTIEPIYSFGPVSVNGAAGGYSGGSGYSSYSHQGAVKPYSSSYASSYAAPAGLQFHAMIPYMIHRQPLSHHSFANVQAKPEVAYYFDNQEPVVVEGEEHGHAQQSTNSPVSLYCQSMKSKDLIKTLAPEGKANATEDDFSAQGHIERVNEIKEEISQLNQAAQRIVDQQEKLAQMQQEHINMAERNANPESRSYPVRGPFRIRRPHLGYRENEDLMPPAPKEDAKAEHDEMMRQVYPYSGYDNYYGYRSAWPYMPTYQTGLPIYKTQVAPENHQDDVEFFMRMLDMGKRMGVLSKNFQPSMALPSAPVKKEEEVKSEDLIDDLTAGGMQKGAEKASDSPATSNVATEAPKMGLSKKDKRGLLPRRA